MSRRDIIIVAVLINAGLLIVLFASALKSNSSSAEFVAAPTPVIQETPAPMFKKESPVAGDEVDQALNHFSQNSVVAATPAAPQMPTHPAMPMTSPTAAPSNFAEDLQAIALPESPVAQPAQAPTMQILTAPMPSHNKPASEFTEVKVKKGDVLEKIARYHHTTVAEIMKANKLTSSNLRIGQVLKVPNKAINKAEVSPIAYTHPVPTAAVNNVATDTGTRYYVVKKGDNPWTIAVKNHLKVEDLLKLNNMNEEQARRLKPGDQLRIK